MEYRSPPQERSTPTSATDSEQYPYYPQRFPSSTNVLRQQKSRRSTSGSLLSSYDESGAGSLKNTASALSVRTSQFKRESYDHAMFSEPNSADSTFPVEDSVRQLHLEDQPPLSSKPDSLPFYYSHSHRHNQNQYQHQHQIQIRNPSLHTSRSRPGMKRKPSPPPDLSHGANAQLLAVAGMNADLYHQRNANASQHPKPRLSPGNQLGPNHRGSFSSQSSAGPHNNSYASSAPLSVGGSSITSTDQHSPGISPSSDHPQYYQQQNGQDSPYVNSFSMNSDARNTRSQQQYLQAPLEPQDTPSSDKKPQQLQTQPRPNAPNMQSPAFICACCPKRPKKFDTPEELRYALACET